MSLKLVPGNDAEIKRYLATLVKVYKDESRRLRKQLEETQSSLSDQLNVALSTKDTLQHDFERIKSESNQTVQHIKLAHAEEMSREKEKAMTSLKELQQRFDSEKRELVQKYEAQVGPGIP